MEVSQRKENSHSEAGAGFRARGARGRCASRGANLPSRRALPGAQTLGRPPRGPRLPGEAPTPTQRPRHLAKRFPPIVPPGCAELAKPRLLQELS